MTGDQTWLWWTLGGLGAAIVLWLFIVWRKGRPFAAGDIFRASRLSRGNRLLPTQVLITPTSVVHYTPGWIGRQEESIHMAHIASVKIDTGVLLSDVLIETSGGQSPIRCHGHRKADAVRMKLLIEQHQNDYFRSGGTSAVSKPAAPPPISR
jgi:LPXTG-motif cell wall-anchored protein